MPLINLEAFRNHALIFPLVGNEADLRQIKTEDKNVPLVMQHLRKNELNSDVARFTTCVATNQVILGGKIFDSLCSNLAKQVARFLLPVLPYSFKNAKLFKIYNHPPWLCYYVSFEVRKIKP